MWHQGARDAGMMLEARFGLAWLSSAEKKKNVPFNSVFIVTKGDNNTA